MTQIVATLPCNRSTRIRTVETGPVEAIAIQRSKPKASTKKREKFPRRRNRIWVDLIRQQIVTVSAVAVGIDG